MILQFTCRSGGALPAAAARLSERGLHSRRFALGAGRRGFDLVVLSSLAAVAPNSLDDYVGDGGSDTVGPWVSTAARAGAAHYDSFAAEARPFFQGPDWTRELAGSLAWRLRFAYRFRRAAHINVLEAVAYGTLLRNLAATAPSSRPVILTDSRVVLGASAKGRSSSNALNGVLRASLPYLLGGDLYPGGVHVNSEDNPGDDPSRDRPLRAPSLDRPAWLDELAANSHRRFDAVLAGAAFPRVLGRWVRLLLLLGGDLG